MAHPHHAAVAAEVRRWYTQSAPEIGMTVEHRPWGSFTCFAHHAGGARLVLTTDSADDVPRALAETGAASEDRSFDVWVEDRDRDARLRPALLAAGWQAKPATTYLALVGHIQAATPPGQLGIRDVSSGDDLEQWCRVKLAGFADREDPVDPDDLARELTVRRSEQALASYQLAFLGGESVASLGYYPGDDQLVFSLATRLPFRHRGIAQGLLAAWAGRGRQLGCRSLIINADEHGRPAALYRRMGFVDEVYWQQRYEAGAR